MRFFDIFDILYDKFFSFDETLGQITIDTENPKVKNNKYDYVLVFILLRILGIINFLKMSIEPTKPFSQLHLLGFQRKHALTVTSANLFPYRADCTYSYTPKL